MKTYTHLSMYEPTAQEFIEIALKKYGYDLEKFKSQLENPPREDYLLVSEKYPIYVVADGVTLIQFLLEKKEYPNPSPAGDVARIFCEEALKEAESRYESFGGSDIKEVFKVGNEAVVRYNREHGRTKESVDYWDIDFFAATAALVVIKEEKAYWGSICDSYVMHFDENGAMRFRSPDCNSLSQTEAPKFIGDSNDPKAKAQYTWQFKRNSVNEKGELTGYGVITGEPEALLYLSSGNFAVQEGELVSVLTDGFEDYMKLPEFISFISEKDDDLKEKIKELSAKKIAENPNVFGHERSLVVVYI